jgi:hypothetical protein
MLYQKSKDLQVNSSEYDDFSEEERNEIKNIVQM